MATTLPPLPPSQLQEDAAHAPTISSLSTLSTLWVPLDETAGQWADFGKEAITVSALLATGTAFHGLAWETKALGHYTCACHERTQAVALAGASRTGPRLRHRPVAAGALLVGVGRK